MTVVGLDQLITSLRLQRQDGGLVESISAGIRQAIDSGLLEEGSHLPASRQLSKALNVGRGTVVRAYAQLKAEGYLRSTSGSKTCVACCTLPLGQRGTKQNTKGDSTPQASDSLEAFSRQGRAAQVLKSAANGAGQGPTRSERVFAQLLRKVKNTANADAYRDATGFFELRRALAGFLRENRQSVCDESNIVITNSLQQSLFLIIFLLLSRGDYVWIEDGLAPNLTILLNHVGATEVSIAVDTAGLDVSSAIERAGHARMAIVGGRRSNDGATTMTIDRRLQLLEWARSAKAWVVEIDQENGAENGRKAVPSLQRLDPSCVISCAALTADLIPSLGLAYVVVPQTLASALAGARALCGGLLPEQEQRALAAYIDQGHLRSHLRGNRMSAKRAISSRASPKK
jgi:GntR family transcriptional regulator / MocR family aminotransferase